MKNSFLSMMLALLCGLALLGCTDLRPRAVHLRNNPGMDPAVRQAILAGQLRVGMTRMDVFAAWGPSATCSRGWETQLEHCVYAIRHKTIDLLGTDVRYEYRSVLFENGYVKDWQYH